MGKMRGLVEAQSRTDSISVWPLTSPELSGKGVPKGGQEIKAETVSLEGLQTYPQALPMLDTPYTFKTRLQIVQRQLRQNQWCTVHKWPHHVFILNVPQRSICCRPGSQPMILLVTGPIRG